MDVTCEIEDYSNPSKPRIKVHNDWCDGDKVEIEIDGKRYTVVGAELISAIERCTLNTFGR